MIRGTRLERLGRWLRQDCLRDGEAKGKTRPLFRRQHWAALRGVLDTNVLLSALISPHGPPDVIYRAWRAGRVEWLTRKAQLEEMRRGSRYPKFKAVLQPHRVGVMINNLQRAELIENLPCDIETVDPNDAFLLAMAMEGAADHLVTGDHRARLLQRGHFGRTRIVAPASFCAEAL